MKGKLSKSLYIKESELNNREYSTFAPAPLFRKEIVLEGNIRNAKVYVQGVGIAKYFLNGESITDDLFISPNSDYRKILWYNVYDVTKKIKRGKNTFGVMLGNGFYNENFQTPWNFDKAEWRDSPKFAFCLEIDGKIVMTSDETWKCTIDDSFIIYNELRTGEYFDARKYSLKWSKNDYDDSGWHYALPDKNPPSGKFKRCVCPPIREVERISPVRIFSNKNGYVVDFGKNMSGYAEIKVKQKAGDEISLQYSEELDADNLPKHNLFDWYPKIDFQRDKLICSGKTDVYKPFFTYHGFRYLEISGLNEEPLKDDVTALFVHQRLKRHTYFKCSNELINRIYDAGIRATESNMFYGLTDCPTREKLYWTNDAQASMEQVLINFGSVEFLEKWYEDIKATLDDEKGMTGIAPSPDWCYESGPVCDGILYELPYRIYQYTGNKEIMISSLPYFYRYIRFLNKKIDEKYDFWLADWMGNGSFLSVPKEFVFEFYRIKAYKIIVLAEKLAGVSRSEDIANEYKKQFIDKYNDSNGYATIETQTALAMQICYGLYKDFAKVKEQLINVVNRDKKEMKCGMVGAQYIYDALTLCGRSDIALDIITESNPGYRTWFENGATTLWELWDGKDVGSHNHHMYSGVLAWFFKALLGYNVIEGSEIVELKPDFVRQLSFCEGSVITKKGKLSIKWEKENEKVLLEADVPNNLKVIYKGKLLKYGKNNIVENFGNL